LSGERIEKGNLVVQFQFHFHQMGGKVLSWSCTTAYLMRYS